MLQITPIKAFSDNYIWVISNHSQAAVVDPGDAQPVLDYCRRLQLRLNSILITHHHPDHTGGISRLRAEYPDLEVFGPAEKNIAGLTEVVQNGQSVYLPPLQLRLKVIGVPGHTLGHIAFYDGQHLFCGDTLFSAGCGRLFEGSPAQMHASLQKLAALPASTQIFCAHEYTRANLHFAAMLEPDNPRLQARIAEVEALLEQQLPSLPTSLEVELATNPFLRVDKPAIQEQAAAHAALSEVDAEQTFALLRAWKDNF